MGFGFAEVAAIRLGYGLSPHWPPPADARAVLAEPALSGPGTDAMTTERATQMAARLQQAQQLRAQDLDSPDFAEARAALNVLPEQDLRRRLARALDAPCGFGERLVQFWCDHFTVRPMGVARFALALAFQDEAIRPHLNGRFEDMFVAAETHPMMLVYLDQITSRGPNSPFARRRPGLGLNENLAREALELHSLGVGAAYSQADVRQLAELLTGLSYDLREGFVFRPQWAEPGAETVLGRSYGGGRPNLADIHSALRDIARRPETARHLSRKLAVHFVADDPPEDLVQALTAAWQDSGGALPVVHEVLVTHPALPATLRHKVRQPLDLLAAGLRALGVTGAQVSALDQGLLRRALMQPLAAMGQPWGQPKGPDGWPERAQSWIAPQMLAARINWALRVPRLLLDELPDPRALVATALGGTQSAELSWAVPRAESAAEGVALVLASADFNRR